jgi:hypothetical protein
MARRAIPARVVGSVSAAALPVLVTRVPRRPPDPNDWAIEEQRQAGSLGWGPDPERGGHRYDHPDPRGEGATRPRDRPVSRPPALPNVGGQRQAVSDGAPRTGGWRVAAPAEVGSSWVAGACDNEIPRRSRSLQPGGPVWQCSRRPGWWS